MKILNFGSLNIDHVYEVEHIVRPGETIGSGGLKKFCGGKGLNQSIALARAGAWVWHAGKVGPEGGMLTSRLERDGVDVSMVRSVEGPTGHAIIQVDQGGENSIVLFGGANQEIDGDYARKVLEAFGPGDVLLLQNEISAMRVIMDLAAEKGLAIAFNPAPFNSRVMEYPLENVSVFIVNETEGQGLTGLAGPGDIIREMRVRFPKAAVILTLGAQGAIYADAEIQAKALGVKVDAVDTTAAGDTFIGYFLALRSMGRDIEESLETACRAAAITVTRPGAADSIPLLKEVDAG